MAITVVANRILVAPCADVFALATDHERFPATFRGYGPIAAIERVTLDAPLAVGSTRRVHQADGVVLTERVDVLDPPHHHAYTLTGFVPPFAWLIREGRADWRMTPAGDGTDTRWSYVFDTRAPWLAPLLAPVLRFAMGRAMQRCLARFALILESPTGAGR